MPPTDTPRPIPQWLTRGAAYGWRLLVVGATVYVIGWLLGQLRAVVLPALLAVFLAALLAPFSNWLERHRFPRWASALVATATLTIAVLGAVALVVVAVAADFTTLVGELRDAMERLFASIERLPVVRNTASFRDRINEGLLTLTEGLTGSATSLASATIQLAMAVLFCFFFLKDGHRVQALERHIRPRRWILLSNVAGKVWTKLGQYMRGIMFVAAVNATLMGIAVWAIGVPLPLAIAVITFVGSLIPYVGPATATTVAALLGFAHGGVVDALLVVGAGILVQFLEGNFISPWVLGRAVKIHPALVLASVTAGAALWGIPGAFFGVPLAASAKIAVRELRDHFGVTPAGERGDNTAAPDSEDLAQPEPPSGDAPRAIPRTAT